MQEEGLSIAVALAERFVWKRQYALIGEKTASHFLFNLVYLGG
jgi:hypothetical protein